jgi:hypothetical protein
MPEDIKEVFTTKIGPLPAIAWGGILGGAYVVYRYIKARNDVPTSPVTEYGDVGDADDFGMGFTNTTPGLGAVGGSIVNGPTIDLTPTDNTSWGKRALDWAISQGFNPIDAQFALATYLFGTNATLNTTQSAILRQILSKFGTPPEGVIIPPPTTPAPPVVVTPKPPVVAAPKPALSPEAAAAFARAKTSFKAAQDLANLFKGPVTGPYGVQVKPGQHPPTSWIPFDEALASAAKAQSLANFVRGPVIGPGGKKYLPA